MLHRITDVLGQCESFGWDLHKRAQVYLTEDDTTRAADEETYPRVLPEILGLSALARDIVVHVYKQSCSLQLVDESLLWRGALRFKDCLRPTLSRLLSAGFCRSHLHEMVDFNQSTMEWIAWWGESTGIPRLEDHDDVPNSGASLTIQGNSGNSHRVLRLRRLQKDHATTRRVLTALELGQIPLVRVSKHKKNNRMTLEIYICGIEELRAVEYVTISRVWRYGRGGSTESGVLQRQSGAIWASVFSTYLSVSSNPA